MFKFKVGDQVKITAGKDKGQTGKISQLLPKLDKIVVEGKNLYTRHLKAAAGKPGSKTKLPRPLPTANIALVCPSCQKTTRVGFDITQKPKIRICRRCGQVIKNQVATKK
jgi:large subunit ribosomal protein L24